VSWRGNVQHAAAQQNRGMELDGLELRFLKLRSLRKGWYVERYPRCRREKNVIHICLKYSGTKVVKSISEYRTAQ
jgi:hypothetical protein